MDNWFFSANDSGWLYLNSFSVGALIPVAFFAITGFFLLSVKNKSKATLHLGIGYIMMGFYNLGLVIASSIYHPDAVYHRWMAIPAILLAEIHCTMLLFLYPDEKNPRATKYYFWGAYLFVISVCVYFIGATLHSNKTFVTLGQYWDFDAIGANKLIALVVLVFIFLVPVLACRRAFVCKGKDRWIVLLFGVFLLLGSFVPGVFNLLNRLGVVDRNAFQMMWAVFTMSGFFLLIMLYVNNAREKISFVGKLITVTAITILAILHFISHYSMKDRDAAYDETHLKDALLVLESEYAPPDMAYQVVYDLAERGLAVPDGVPLPVDEGVVKRDLYNTAMMERIRRFPETRMRQGIGDLLSETPAHFEGFKRALLMLAQAPESLTDQSLTRHARRLNRLLFIHANKIQHLPDPSFRAALTAHLEKLSDRAFDPFKSAMLDHLRATTREGAALKTEMLSLLAPLNGGEQRVYRKSRDGAIQYIAFAVPDLPKNRMLEVGFDYRYYRLYMHKAVVHYVAMILILILISRYGFYWFFKGLLVNPLKALTKGVYAVESGNLDVSVPVVVEDEIGFITRAFNHMVAAIRESKQKLLEEADNLMAAHACLEASSHEIRLLQHYLSNIIESMPSVLISIDEMAKVTQWNAAAEKLTGIRATDILGKTLWDVRSPFRKLEPYHKNVQNTRKPLLMAREKLEGTALASTGDDKYYNIALYPLVANGISGTVVRIDDITELEIKDQQLRQVQKMETVGLLAGGLAHDFNNILGGIIGTLSLLKFKLEKNGAISLETAREYVDTMEKAGQRAADMVQQLLTLSRKRELAFAPVDLNMAIKHVVKICEGTFDKSIDIKTIYAADYPVVNADPGQLEQALLNLCINAGHAMTLMRPPEAPKGGVLTISLSKVSSDRFFCEHHPEAMLGEQYWSLSVQDTGVGMDTKTIAKIFDPFFTTKEKGKGTGLGLAMVYNIIQQHKGFIDVYSEKGHGSTFSIYLPRLAGAGASDLEETRKPLPKGQGLVLVVDDEAMMRELAGNILAECGYDTIMAENGVEGLERFKKEHHRIDMVMLDMVMPKMSGRETFLAMKAVDPEVKVLLTSGFGKNENIEEIMSLGVKDFLKKPFTLDELAGKIRDVMEGAGG